MPRKTADHQSASRRARKRLLLAITVPLGALGLTAFLSFSFARILLGVPKAAAPVVAILVSTAVLAVAAFIASRPRVRAADLVSLFGLVAGVALVAGGLGIVTGGTSADQEGTGQKPAETLMIAAQGIAFNRDTLEPPWGKPFAIEFTNSDVDTPHNVAIYTDSSASTRLFVGEIFPGAASRTYSVPALDPGTYFFRCDVHPTQMTGSVVVG
jgi:plastocyanin